MQHFCLHLRFRHHIIITKHLLLYNKTDADWHLRSTYEYTDPETNVALDHYAISNHIYYQPIYLSVGVMSEVHALCMSKEIAMERHLYSLSDRETRLFE